MVVTTRGGGGGMRAPQAHRSAALSKTTKAISLSKPLTTIDLSKIKRTEVKKTTWGTGVDGSSGSGDTLGSLLAGSTGATPAASSNGDVGNAASSKGKGRGKTRPRAASGTVMQEPEPPAPQDNSAAGLLSRLLSKRGDDAPLSTAPTMGTQLELSSSDDFFSYLRTGPTSDSDKPFNALDFGAPPSGGNAEEGDDDTEDTQGTLKRRRKTPKS